MDPRRDLLTHFRTYFEIVRADTPTLLEEAFRLRYQVYCHEARVTGFERNDYPGGLEHDNYDWTSAVHCLLKHRPSGAYAGVVRLVLADPTNPDASLPIQAAAGGGIPGEHVRKFASCRKRTGEISRLILAERFRLRKGEQQWPDGMAEVIDTDHGQEDQRVLPHPVLGLVKALTMMTWEQGIDYVFAAIEPRLDRRLRRFGLVLEPLSPLLDYHGLVRVHWAGCREVLSGVHVRHPEIWALLTDNGEFWPTPGGTQASPERRKIA